MRKKLSMILLIVICAVIALGGCSFFGGDKTETRALMSPYGLTYVTDSYELRWAKVSNAVSYKVLLISADGTEKTVDVTTNSLSLTEYYGSYTAKVMAIGNGKEFTDSIYCNPVSIKNKYVLPQLEYLVRAKQGGGISITIYSDATIAAYSLAVDDTDVSVSLSASDFSDGEYTFDLDLGTNYGTYTLRYSLSPADSTNYKSTIEESTSFVFEAPRGVELPSEVLTIDKNSTGTAVFNVQFRDAQVTGIASDFAGFDIALTDIVLDYRRGIMTLRPEFVIVAPVGSFSVTMNTSLGSVNFVLAIRDTRVPYAVTKSVNYNNSDGDLKVSVNLCSTLLQSVTVDDTAIATEDFEYDATTFTLTVAADALSGLSHGEHTMTLHTNIEDQTVTIALNALTASSLYFECNEFFYDLANIGSIPLIFKAHHYTTGQVLISTSTVFYRSGAIVSASSYAYNANADMRIWKWNDSFLQNLTVGDHYFLLNSDTYNEYFKVTITNSAEKPSDIRLDTNTAGELVVTWDTSRSGPFTVVAAASGQTVTRETATNSIAVSEFALNAESYAITVIDKQSGMAGDEFTFSVPSIPVEYAKGTYTFLGETSNLVISSAEELEDAFRFLAFCTNKTTVTANNKAILNFYCTIPTDELDNAFDTARAKVLSSDDFSGLILGRDNVTLGSRQGNSTNSLILSYVTSKMLGEATMSTGQTENDVTNSPFVHGCYYPNTRTSDYSFALDSVTRTQSVSTSYELFYVAEKGVRPVPMPGSSAETLYGLAREVLLDICDDSMSDLEKVHSIYDWIILNTTYDKKIAAMLSSMSDTAAWGYKVFSINGVLVDGVAVCDGIARTMVLMCALEGIPAFRANGKVGEVSHAWVKTLIDGIWYTSDPTFGNKADQDLSAVSYTEYLFHDYLLMSDATAYIDHTEKTKCRNLACGAFDVYAYSNDDNLYSVSTYAEITSLVNAKLTSVKYLEFDLVGLEAATVATKLSAAEGLSINADYIHVSTAKSGRAVSIAYTFVNDVLFNTTTVNYDKKNAISAEFEFEKRDATSYTLLLNGDVLSPTCYSFVGTKLVLNDAWLRDLLIGPHVIRFKTDLGSTYLTVNVNDTRAAEFVTNALTYSTVIAEDLDINVSMYNDSIISVEMQGTSEDFLVTNTSWSVSGNTFTIASDFLCADSLPSGKYSLVITTSHNASPVSISLEIVDTDTSYPYVAGSSVTFDKADPKNIVFVVKNLLEENLYSTSNSLYADKQLVLTKDTDYVIAPVPTMTSIGYTLKATSLSAVPCGEYTIMVANKLRPVYMRLNVVDTAAAAEKPSNIRLDYNTDGEAIIVWDYSTADSFNVSVGSESTTTAVNSVLVSTLSAASSFSVTVTAASTNSAATATITKPDQDVTLYTAPHYFGDMFTNNYISSDEDFADAFLYHAFMGTDETKFYYATAAISSDELNRALSFAFNSAMKMLGGCSRITGYSGAESYGRIITIPFILKNDSPNMTSGQTAAYVSQSTMQTACYATYESNRTASSTLAIDMIDETVSVTTTDQMMYAVQQGYRPVPTVGSPAATCYAAARAVLIDILDDRLSDYQKVHYIYDYLITNTAYDHKMLDELYNTLTTSQQLQYKCFYLEGVFIDRIAVCDGLSKALVLMCNMEGITAKQISGNSHGVSHAWSKVCINGIWYSVDNTWGDSGVATRDSLGRVTSYTEYLSHNYLLVDDNQLYMDHNENDIEMLSKGNYSNAVYDADGDSLFLVTDTEELISIMNTYLKASYDCIELKFTYLDNSTISAEMQSINASLNTMQRNHYGWLLIGDTAVVYYRS